MGKKDSITHFRRHFRLDHKCSIRKLDTTARLSFSKEEIESQLVEMQKSLSQLQENLFAQKKYKILIVLQGLDTSGKDGTVKHVFRTCNPQGLRAVSFKQPTDIEKEHDFLWRVHRQVPMNGEIVIFNRSHYEDYVVPDVHKTLKKSVLKERIKEIRHFERSLSDEDTIILKFFLHISRTEQAKRIKARLDRPEKHWKFSLSDLSERQYWDAYQKSYDHIMKKTDEEEHPWFIIPADDKRTRDFIISHILVESLKALHPKPPRISPQVLKKLEKEIRQYL